MTNYHRESMQVLLQIESLADCYRLHHVPYRGNLHTVDWSKELLDEGKRHQHPEWISLTQDTKWKIPDMPLYHATLATLYRHKDHPKRTQKKLVHEIQELFHTDFDPAKPDMITSTRIRYGGWTKINPQEKVIHSWGYAGAQTDFGFLTGHKTWINPSLDSLCSGLESKMKVLLGNNDLAEIEKVYEWVSGNKPYLLVLFQPSYNDTILPVGLGSNNYKFNINCYVSISGCARGIVATKILKEGMQK